MTETAIHVLEDGSEEETKIEDVTDAMAHDTYLCNGCGGTCRVEMYAVSNGKEPHFHTKRNQHHAFGCDNDHSIAAQIVRSLDHTGSTTSMEELLDKFIRAHLEDEDEEHGKGDKGKKGKGDGKPKGAGDDGEDKTILREPRNPRNIRELCALFSKKYLDDTYAGLRIGDIFFDHRNIASARKEGLPDDKLVIVLLAKISNKRREDLKLNVPEGAIVLGDAYSYVDKEKQLFFIIPCASASVRKSILSARSSSIISVFCKWRKFSADKENVYICDPINEGQFFCAEENFYEW